MSDDGSKKTCPSGDVLKLGPDLGGVRPYVRHHTDHSIQTGFMKPVQDGEPLTNDAVFLRQRGQTDEFDVEPVFGESRGTGPAQVATDAYRNGWDMIFGGKTATGLA